MHASPPTGKFIQQGCSPLLSSLAYILKPLPRPLAIKAEFHTTGGSNDYSGEGLLALSPMRGSGQAQMG